LAGVVIAPASTALAHRAAAPGNDNRFRARSAPAGAGLLFGWATIAIAVPVLPRADFFPHIVFLIALGAVATYLPERWTRLSPRRFEQIVWSVALFGLACGMIRLPFLSSMYDTPMPSNVVIVIAQLSMLLGALLLAPPVRQHVSTRVASLAVWCGVAASTLAGAALIMGVPDPLIDVFYFLNEGARALINGQDPYTLTFTPVLGAPNPVYGYLPGVLLATLPTVPFGDVRWAMLACIPLSAIFLRNVFRLAGTRQAVADLLVLSFVSYPGLLWVVREAWVEPLVVCAFYGAVWAVLARREQWAIVLVGAFLAIKQFTPLLIMPIWIAGLRVRKVMLAVAIALAVCLPFFVWAPSGFWFDVVEFHRQGPPRVDAVSFSGYLLAVYATPLPAWISILAPALAVGYALWRAARGASWRTLLRLTAGAYFVLFLSDKFAFANYYFLVQAIALAAAGVAVGPGSGGLAEQLAE
jgi:hypothetical protein